MTKLPERSSKKKIADLIGIGLSGLCTIHCLLISFFMMSMPILARYYLSNPYIHVILAVFILPIGSLAFFNGFRKHENFKILLFGLVSILAVGGIPAITHLFNIRINEPLYLGAASIFLIAAHCLNLKTSPKRLFKS